MQTGSYQLDRRRLEDVHMKMMSSRNTQIHLQVGKFALVFNKHLIIALNWLFKNSMQVSLQLL